VLSSDNEATIDITVSGGTTPYTIILNWGDGTTDTHTVDQPGTYTFTHTYEKSGDYTIHGLVRDVLGATTVLQYAVVSGQPSRQGQASSSSQSGSVNEEHWYQSLPPTAVIGTASAVAVAGVGYLFGLHHAAAQLLQTGQSGAQRGVRPRAKPRPRPRPKAKGKRR
jgi:hypothetical protein